jgi:predicted nuclease with TOPRIM domain
MDNNTIKKVQRWVDLDNKIEMKKMKLKEYVDEKKDLEEDIIEFVTKNDKKNLQINTSDGQITFIDQKTTQMFTVKYLKEALNAFFQQQHVDAVDAKTILDFVCSNREIKQKVIMKRQITS